MDLFNQNSTYDFLGKRKLAMAFSLALIAVSFISLATMRLNLGIDFTGGTDIQVRFEPVPDIAQIRDVLAAAGIEGAQVQEFGAHGDGVNVFEVLAALAEREINDVLVEAGPRLAGYLVEKELVDELVIYIAPHIMGSETRGMFDTPHWLTLAGTCRHQDPASWQNQ